MMYLELLVWCIALVVLILGGMLAVVAGYVVLGMVAVCGGIWLLAR